MAALKETIPASNWRPNSAELSFACNAICPKIALQVDLVISMQLFNLSVSHWVSHIFVALWHGALFVRIKPDWFQTWSSCGTSEMCQLIAKICSFICKSTDSTTYTVNILSKNLSAERDFWFQKNKKANVDCKNSISILTFHTKIAIVFWKRKKKKASILGFIFQYWIFHS